MKYAVEARCSKCNQLINLDGSNIREHGHCFIYGAVLPARMEFMPKVVADTKQADKYNELFQEFWGEFPKKEQKIRAFNVLLKLKPTKKTFEKIMADVRKKKNSVRWTQEKKKFCPLAANYLKNQEWEDDEWVDYGETGNGGKVSVTYDKLY